MPHQLFRTPIEIPDFEPKISYGSKLMLIGSCFTENIGNLLLSHRFNTVVNPFGIVYNPASIASNLAMLMEKKQFTETDLNFYNELWFSFYHHSDFSSIAAADCLTNINNTIEKSSEFLSSADYLILTLGTSWIYQFRQTGQLVNNCHKMPSSLFDRTLLNVDDIKKSLSETLQKLNEFNPKLRIILTVSPVRHWKDGAVANQISKSTIIIACHQLMQRFEQVSYFPAYEIMMDELRDYRFYASDMLHPNQIAVDYIWDCFVEKFLNKEARNAMELVKKIVSARNHLPLFPESKNFNKFVQISIRQIQNIQNQFPAVDLTADMNYFQKLLL